MLSPRRTALACTLAVLLLPVTARPLLQTSPQIIADDKSRMNPTPIQQAWDIPADDKIDTAAPALRDLLLHAAATHSHISIAGSQHSMGGQTLAPNTIRINMLPLKAMALDESTDILHVQTGALWADVIPYLDRRGRSVAVMQSNNNFTVGGSLSVNCHGWQYGRPPIASTVESFHIMRASGEILRCSRTENKELFSLALGGYGLFGIILDVDLHVVKNQRLRSEQHIVPLDQALATFDRTLADHGTPSMFYARLDIVPSHMFDDVLLTTFHPEPGEIPTLSDPKLLALRRFIFRESVGSDFGKQVRWHAETRIAPHIAGTVFSRNQLLNDPADWYLDHSAATTDILHEYFLPRASAVAFLRAARPLLQAHHANLLNLTVREVQTDEDTYLRFADQPLIAFVMFFNQRRTPAADADMELLTQQLIDPALAAGGRYLPPLPPPRHPAAVRRRLPPGPAILRPKTNLRPRQPLPK